MKTKRVLLTAREIQQRASEIRRHWSRSERMKRMGLPPDLPSSLYRHFGLYSCWTWQALPVAIDRNSGRHG